MSEGRREIKDTLRLSAAVQIDDRLVAKRLRYAKRAPSYQKLDAGRWSRAVIPPELQLTRRGTQFLHYDSLTDPAAQGKEHRAAAFCTLDPSCTLLV